MGLRKPGSHNMSTHNLNSPSMRFKVWPSISKLATPKLTSKPNLQSFWFWMSIGRHLFSLLRLLEKVRTFSLEEDRLELGVVLAVLFHSPEPSSQKSKAVHSDATNLQAKEWVTVRDLALSCHCKTPYYSLYFCNMVT